MCSDLEVSGFHKSQENTDQTCTRILQYDRFPITMRQGHTNQMAPSSDIQTNLHSLAHSNGRLVYNSSKPQTTNSCFFCPKYKGLENRCNEYLLGRPRQLCLQSSSHHATSNSKNNILPMPDDCTSSTVARNRHVGINIYIYFFLLFQ